MAVVDLVMPKLGESIMEATVLKWHKQPGDTVTMDETVLDIATDKVDSEVPSTASGVIEEILYKVNDVVPIGTVIARIRTAASQPVSSGSGAGPSDRHEEKAHVVQDAIVVNSFEPVKENQYAFQQAQKQPQTNGSSNRFYSPLVLNIA